MAPPKERRGPNLQLATFGAGCFWSAQRSFAELAGVVDTRTGYMGGHREDPTYADVCEGDSGHIEVVEVEFDADVISYLELLDAFWRMHDPTSWDAQGNDEGEQYRSVIFVADEDQTVQARASMARAAEDFQDDIVTLIRQTETFWVAEDDHQDFLPRSDPD